jgi:hypothetical protein
MFAQRSLSGMSRLLAASLLASAVLPVLAIAQPAPSAHAAAKLRHCPNPKPYSNTKPPPVYFRVRGVSCRSAYALAKKVTVRAPRGCMVRIDETHVRLTRPCHAGGYRCTARSIGMGIAVEATCRRAGQKLVRFQAAG